MGQTATMRQQARATARARRVAMDAERDARDRRIEEATAEALVLLGERTHIEHQLDQTNREIADALRRLVAEAISTEAAANLVELEVGDVRRLMRLVSVAPESAASATRRNEAVPQEKR